MTSSSSRRQSAAITIASLLILLSSPSFFVMGKKPSLSVKCIDNTDGTNNPAVIYHLSNNELRPYPNMDFYYWNGYEKDHFPGVGRHINCTGIPIGSPYDVQPETIVSQEAYKFMPMFKMRTDQKCQPGIATRHEVGKCRVERPVNVPLYYESATVEESNGTSKSTLHSYWVYYGMQSNCGPFDAGKHKDDWEHVDIHVQDGKIKHVIYSQHGGMYTLSKKDVPMENGRVVVYVGKYSHGSYHDQRKKCKFDKGCKKTGEYCKYWKDPRTGKSFDWYPSKLLSLPGFRVHQENSVPIDDPVCKLETGGFEWGGIEFEGPTNTCKRNPRYLTYTNKAKPMTVRDMMMGNYRPGSAVKCLNGTTGKTNSNPHTVYRFQNRALRPYPSSSIFKSWDSNYPHFDTIDCTYLPIGRPMGYNLNHSHEGKSIKCSNSNNIRAVYRWTNGQLRLYPNPLVALSWNRFWNRILTINCRGLPVGEPMERKPNSPPEGQAIRCTGLGADHHIYRWTNSELRHYPSPAIFASWSGGDSSSMVAYCGGQNVGRPMTWNVSRLPEGKSLRCSGSRTVYRWTNGELRGYPNRDIFESCDGNWSNIGNIDCRGLRFGRPMGQCNG